MVKILFSLFLLILSQSTYSQAKSNTLLGEIIWYENIIIENDSVKQKFFITDKGFCYAIMTKFKNKSIRNLDELKNILIASNIWNDDENYEKEKFSYQVSYENLDVDETGLVFSSKMLGLDDDSSIGFPTKYWQKERSIQEFLSLPGVIQAQKELLSKYESEKLQKQNEIELEDAKKLKEQDKIAILNAVPLENIDLPYRFRFGMSELQVLSQLKTLLEKTSTYKSYEDGPYDQLNKSFGIKYFRYDVKDGAFSFYVRVKFYKGKAFEFEYHPSQELDSTLRMKIQTLLKKYNKLATDHGNDIYETETFEKIQKLHSDYQSRGSNIGKKM